MLEGSRNSTDFRLSPGIQRIYRRGYRFTGAIFFGMLGHRWQRNGFLGRNRNLYKQALRLGMNLLGNRRHRCRDHRRRDNRHRVNRRRGWLNWHRSNGSCLFRFSMGPVYAFPPGTVLSETPITACSGWCTSGAAPFRNVDDISYFKHIGILELGIGLDDILELNPPCL